jgi:Mn2+/Fe2+ NRAMP family transporter
VTGELAVIEPIRMTLINGVVAPPLLVLIVLLGSDRRLMGGNTSRGRSRGLGWAAAIIMSAAALAEVFSLLVARKGP